MYFGYSMVLLSFLGFGFATEGWMMFALVIPFSLGGLAGPALRGIMSNQVPANAQGELQGAITSLMSLTMVGSPIVMTQLFYFFSAEDAPIYFPGAPYVLAGAMIAAGLLQVLRTVRHLPTAISDPAIGATPS